MSRGKSLRELVCMQNVSVSTSLVSLASTFRETDILPSLIYTELLKCCNDPIRSQEVSIEFLVCCRVAFFVPTMVLIGPLFLVIFAFEYSPSSYDSPWFLATGVPRLRACCAWE
jgi:hypothetical protein